ncbi:MAG: TolC family protein [Bryobacteraceae bacterium]|jgi:outer membrane protein
MTRRLLTPLLLLPASLLAQQQPMHLTLADAQRLAVQNNPQYSSAKYTAAAAHQQPAQYRAAELPNLAGLLTGVGADNGTRLAAGAINNPVVYSRAAGGILASQLITDFGRTHNLVGMSNLQAQAQDQASDNTRADVLLGATRAYFDVLRAQAVLKVAQQTVAARQLVFDRISALAQSQLRTELDVSFANVNLSDAKLLQLQAENGINSAEAELAAALGLPNQTTFDVADEPMPAALPAQADPLIAQAMQNRPDLKDLQLLQSAAERFTRAEHDLYYPTVSGLVAAGGVPVGVSQVPGHYAAAGINVNIPVFNGGLFKARESEASLKAKAAAQNVADLANRITRDVRVAWLNANTAFQRVSLTQQFVAQAQLALDLAQSRYQLGLSSIVELSQAQLNLTSAQIESASARYDYQAQRSVVDYQIGVLR